jgi:hypothetical protein
MRDLQQKRDYAAFDFQYLASWIAVRRMVRAAITRT